MAEFYLGGPVFEGRPQPIEGFDSPAGVDVTVDLELQLGIGLPHNVFVKTVNGRPRARTLNEVVDVLCRMLGAEES